MKSTGFIYAISFGENVKIGTSRFPQKRIKSISAMNGCENPQSYISVEVESHVTVEAKIHKYLEDKKVFCETFKIAMPDAISVINKLCVKVSDKRKAELLEDYNAQQDVIRSATSALFAPTKELEDANERLLQACILDCNNWLDNFGSDQDASEFMDALRSPTATMAISIMMVTGNIKSKAIGALMSALNGNDEDLMSIGFKGRC